MAISSDCGIRFPVRLALEMLPARLVPERTLSEEESQQFCFMNEAVQIERDSDGAIHLYPMNVAVTSMANSEITCQLRNWSKEQRSGLSAGSSAGFFLPDGSMLCPNAAFIKDTKYRTMPRKELACIPHFAPDFVIELASNWKTLDTLRQKMLLWIANGVSLAWQTDPDERAVTVYRPHAKPVEQTGDWLDGDGPVAGLRFDLLEIWSCYES